MPHSSSMPRFVTSIINDQPKPSLAFVNIRIPIVSGNRQTRSGKNDVPCNALVDYCDSREYEVQEKEYVTMESNETTHLLYGKSIYETIQLTDPKEALEDTEPMHNDFRYYAIDPSCMNIRICMFWFLWAMLIVVLVVSILSYCGVVPKMCDSFGIIVTLNATNT